MDFKALRAAKNKKAQSMIESSGGKVDSSTWTPDEKLNADAKTGMRPISRRAFKAGGKVEGENAKTNLSRTPRGFQEKVGLANTNQKDANEEREGVKHVGGFKRGGRTGMMGGGLPIKQKGKSAMVGTDDYDPMYEYNPVELPEENPMRPSKRKLDEGQALMEEEQRRMGDMTRRKHGGKAENFEGSAKDMMEDKKMAAKRGMSMKEWEASDADKKRDMQSAKASGGKLKMVEKDGKKVPDFAADGVGKMKSGGRTKMNTGGSDFQGLAPSTEVRKHFTAEDGRQALRDMGDKTRRASGGRTGKMGGGSMGMGMSMPSSPMMPAMNPMASGYKSGGKAMHHKDCVCKACGGSAGYKDGGKTEKNDSTYGVRTALRLKKTVTGSNPEKSAKIYKDQDFGEYRVKHYEGGKHNEAADYHTDDMDDAHATASDFVNKKRGGSAGMKSGGGLYANINAKRERIENGSGEKMRKVGSKGAPDAEDFKDSAKTAKKEMGGRMGRATGGRAGKGTTNISINVMPHSANKPMGIQPPMPPMPPVGGPPPMMPPPSPPRMSLPPGLGAAMAGAAGEGPMPPPPGAPMPMMGRKDGGKVYPKMKSGAGGGKGRLEKIDEYGKNA